MVEEGLGGEGSFSPCPGAESDDFFRKTSPMPTTKGPRYSTILRRALGLRCPRCGEGGLFTSWFRMATSCQKCGLVFEREPGFFLGSTYINYGLTTVLMTIGYFTLYFFEVASSETLLWIMVAFCFVFPLWFFRYARSLWLGFDHYWDPREPNDAL